MTDLEAGRSEAAGIPSRVGLDRTAGLLLEGYPFLADCRRRWETVPLAGGRAVELRLLGERAVCVGGPEGVRLFYDTERFRRRDAVPRPLASTRFPEGRLVPLDAEEARPAGPIHLRAHGGGDPATGHRCAGEQVAVELLKGAVRVLARLRYALPDPPPTCVRRPDRSR